MRESVIVVSLPTRERGLKRSDIFGFQEKSQSLPTRERGLKLGYQSLQLCCRPSLPTRERGLKLMIV